MILMRACNHIHKMQCRSVCIVSILFIFSGGGVGVGGWWGGWGGAKLSFQVIIKPIGKD